MFKPNTLFYSDGYKVGHKRMLAPGTTFLYGSWIPRTIKYAPKGVSKIVSAGQQLTVRWLNDEFTDNFFKLSLEEALKFGRDMSMYLMQEYNADHFAELHKLGYLPVRIKSLPEGIETNPNIPHMTFINTVKGFAWLTLYLETIISSLSWKTSTSATLGLAYRRNALEWVKKTDPTNLWLVDYMCHDFSARGLDPFSMLASGLGHAMSHKGSDTLIVIPGARYFYDEPENEVCINSVNASEHSVSTTKIFTVGEKQMIIDWLKEFPTGILSIVADTFDLWKLLCEYLADPEVKALIMARNGKLVVRPDSGDPVEIICGMIVKPIVAGSYEDFLTNAEEELHDILVDQTPHGEHGGDIRGCYSWEGTTYDVLYSPDWNRYDKQYYYIENWGSNHTTASVVNLEAKQRGVIELLWDTFGGTVNEQGYKVLDSHIGAIYGDSINLERQVQIYSRLANKGFASTNIVLGVGSFTYQFNTRDTLGFAAKGAWFQTEEDHMPDGFDIIKSYNIYKDPVTDDGTKKSLKGLLYVDKISIDGEKDPDYIVMQEATSDEESKGLLQIIFEDGKYYNQTTLTEIRKRLNG